MSPTIVNTPPSDAPISNLGLIVSRSVNRPPQSLNSYLARILELIRSAIADAEYIPNSNLARFLCGPVLAAPVAAPIVLVNRDQQVYASYVAFCKMAVAVPDERYSWAGPRTIEHWDSLRDAQKPKPAAALSTKVDTDKRYRVCPFPAGEPACLTRKPERPITFDEHVAGCIFLPKQIEMEPFAYRTAVKVDNKVVRSPHRKAYIEQESRWCGKCVEYVEQDHVCPIVFDAHLTSCSYYKTARGNTIARHLEEHQWPRERNEERLKRVASFEQLTVNEQAHHQATFVSLFNNAVEGASLPNVVYRTITPDGSCVWWNFDSGSIRHFRKLCRKAMKDKKGVPAPPRCAHLLVRPFTFVCTGQTIKMCPGCTTFDEHRKKVLKQGQVDKLTPAQEASWNHILVEDNLSMGRGKTLSGGWPKGFPITALLLNNKGYELCAKCGEILTTGERVDETRGVYGHPHCRPLPAKRGNLVYMGTIFHLADAEEEEGAVNSKVGQVNTAGNFDTEHEGAAKDACSRDWRGKEIFSREQERDPHAKSVCLWCGEEIWSKDGTNYCPDTNHRQMLFKEKEALLIELWMLSKKLKLVGNFKVRDLLNNN